MARGVAFGARLRAEGVMQRSMESPEVWKIVADAVGDGMSLCLPTMARNDLDQARSRAFKSPRNVRICLT